MAKQANTAPRRQAKKDIIVTQIVKQFKDVSRAEIQKWRKALAAAQNVNFPRTYAIADLCDNLEQDGHWLSQVELRKAATTGYGFSIVDKKTGKINTKKTELFNSAWFYDFMNNCLDSVIKGYTILELVDPANMTFELIPRRNVVGVEQLIILEINGNKGIDISSGYENTLVKVGKPADLGIMPSLCGLLIWKRNAQQSWAEFTERFGMPLISATTNKSSSADIARIQKMLQSLGEAAQAVLPEGTTIDIKPFAGGDAYNIYDKQIERINGEISKPLTGGTMVSDDGSSRSQSEVHERNLDDKIGESDRRMIQFVVNGQLLPIMHYWGWDINPETDKFLFDSSFELTLKEHWEIVNQIDQRYKVSTEWLSKTFNVPIEGEREQQRVVFRTEGLSENFQ